MPRIVARPWLESACDTSKVAPVTIERLASKHLEPTTAHPRRVPLQCRKCDVLILWRAANGLRWWAEHALATILRALTGRALERPHSTPAALTVIPCVRQHNDHRPCRCCPHTGPLPVKRAAAPPVEPRSRQPELASLPHCCGASPVGNGARLKREPWFRQKAFHLPFLTLVHM